MIKALLAEPPLRRFVQFAVRGLPCSVQTKDRWNAADRPQYLAGVLYAAQQAKREGVKAISVVEFGVAEGYGLLALQAHAEAVERETGVHITVWGFDTGGGMPAGTGDYRDHPDVWAPGDYVMNVEALTAKLKARTMLVLGEIRDIALRDLARSHPLGFAAIDVDYYSSTVDALSILNSIPRLRRVAMYFDDLSEHYNHAAAGELRAIQEFNEDHRDIIGGQVLIIDRWRGIKAGRPFPEAPWLDAMYIAHDLAAISETKLSREAARMR